jgi:hypothetical protein
MDQAVRQEILLNLEQETDLNDTQRELLIQVVEEHETEVRDLVEAAQKANPDKDTSDLLDAVLQDLKDQGLLDGKGKVLEDPEHEIWKDTDQCQKQLEYAFTLWVFAEWSRD